ncbi:MAG: metallophosphoesterase family protein, partial [Clostridia bacterium]|nr:metallophosphoesterase family protein [Clostridia bacterium]
GSGKVETATGECSFFLGKYSHKAMITGLVPGRSYEYRVGDRANNKWSDVGRFTVDDGDDEFTFIAVADPQASSDENFAQSAAVMDAALLTAPDAEFYVDLGDYVNDCTMEEWEYYFKNFGHIDAQLTHVPVAGNHDGNLRWGFFVNMFNLDCEDNWQTLTGAYYSFDWGSAHFAVLNTNDMYPMQLEQINWLKNDMNTTDKDWKIVLMHRSLYSAGKNINKPDTIAMRETLLPVMDELGIDLVLSGHDHMYYRSKQVYGDAVAQCRYVYEKVDGRTTKCAVEPSGTVYIVADTCGTKRYYVHEDAVEPILQVADVASQPDENKAGTDPDGLRCAMFTTVSFETGKLTFRAYTVEDGTGDTQLYDTYCIYKTPGQNSAEADYSPLPTDSVGISDDNFSHFVTKIIQMIWAYLTKLLPKALAGMF